jgi:adenylate cyclase
MSVRLDTLDACFDGVIPSIIGTVAADGTPNVSYLSHVVRADEAHVALSNQFFSKTAANVRATGRATLLVVDPRDGRQHRLGLAFVESRTDGALFAQVNAQLRASSAQVGMQDVMQLRAIDIFRVLDQQALPLLAEAAEEPSGQRLEAPLAAAAAIAAALGAAGDVEQLVDTLVQGVARHFGYERVMLLVPDAQRRRLVLLAATGYGDSGTGAEIAFGEGIAGLAVAEGCLLKVNDLSRAQRFAAAAARESGPQVAGPEIPLPTLAGALSQIGVPLVARGSVEGVLFAESPRRHAFPRDDEAALDILARQFTALLRLLEQEGAETSRSQAPAGAPGTSDASLRVVHHVHDDSVFFDDDYVIKGVAGRLLVHLLAIWKKEGRSAFTNRELRLDEALRLPEIKDNLETRLLLLRRRLEERDLPVRIVPAGRGRFELAVSRSVQIEAR